MSKQRTKRVIGNWKMHGRLAGNQALLNEVMQGAGAVPAETSVGVCVPFPYLAQVQAQLGAGRVVAAVFHHREKDQAECQVQAQRLDVAHAAAIDVFERQLSRPEQKEQQRLPKLAFQRDVMADELVQEFARAGRMQHGFLAALVAKIAGNDGAAVRAVARGLVEMGWRVHGIGGFCHINQYVNQLISKKHLPIARPPSNRRIRI